MSNWKKRGMYKTIEEYFETQNIDFNLTNRAIGDRPISHLREAAEFVIANKDLPIYIFGDYDVDGITSTTILAKGLEWLIGSIPVCRLPHRFSEGYGIKNTAIDEFEKAGLIITVDNGISAVSEIEYAKSKGHKVVVLDHHIPPAGKLPSADVIVDAHCEPHDFDAWCGAGVAYRFILEMAALLQVSDNELEEEFLQLAAIATIADVMPLVDENRLIVMQGLASINANGAKNNGLRVLLKTQGLYNINSHTVAFTIAPLINASGRLEDAGANLPLNLLLGDKSELSYTIANKMAEYNDKRKEIVANATEKCENYIKENSLMYDNILFLPIDNIDEGICGLVAGKISGTYNVPAIVVTNSHDDNNVYKGSGRSGRGEEINLKACLDAISDKLITYGGHAAAVGLSLSADKLNEVEEALLDISADFIEKDNSIYYDIEISQSQLKESFEKLSRYEPFGNGNRPPVFKVTEFSLFPRTAGKCFQYMGADSSHIKLYGNGNSAVGFKMAEKYNKVGCPTKLNLIGELSENSFNGVSEVQISLQDIEEAKVKRTTLADELNAFLLNL